MYKPWLSIYLLSSDDIDWQHRLLRAKALKCLPENCEDPLAYPQFGIITGAARALVGQSELAVGPYY